jgi:hypothetical protein
MMILKHFIKLEEIPIPLKRTPNFCLSFSFSIHNIRGNPSVFHGYLAAYYMARCINWRLSGGSENRLQCDTETQWYSNIVK